MGTIPQLRLPHRIQVYAGTQPRINGARDIRSEVRTIKPFDDNGKPLFTFDTERYGKYIPSKKEFGREAITTGHEDFMKRVLKNDEGYTISFDEGFIFSKSNLGEAIRHIVYDIIGSKMFEISYKYYKYLFEDIEDKFWTREFAIGVYWIIDDEYLFEIEHYQLEVRNISSLGTVEKNRYYDRMRDFHEQLETEKEMERQKWYQKQLEEAERANARKIASDSAVKALHKEIEETPKKEDEPEPLEVRVQRLQAELMRKRREQKEAARKARIAQSMVDYSVSLSIDDIHSMTDEELLNRINIYSDRIKRVDNLTGSRRSINDNADILAEMLKDQKNVIKEVNRMRNESARRQRDKDSIAAKEYRAAHADEMKKGKELANETRRKKMQKDVEDKEEEERKRREFEEMQRKSREQEEKKRAEEIRKRDPLFSDSPIMKGIYYDGYDRAFISDFYNVLDDILKQARFLDLPQTSKMDKKDIHNRIIPYNYLATFTSDDIMNYSGKDEKILPDFDIDTMCFVDAYGLRINDKLFGDFYNEETKMYEFYTRPEAFERMLFFILPFCIGQVRKGARWYPSFIRTVFLRLSEVRINRSGIVNFSFNTMEHMHVDRIRINNKTVRYKWSFSFPLGYSELRETMYGEDIRHTRP